MEDEEFRKILEHLKTETETRGYGGNSRRHYPGYVENNSVLIKLLERAHEEGKTLLEVRTLLLDVLKEINNEISVVKKMKDISMKAYRFQHCLDQPDDISAKQPSTSEYSESSEKDSSSNASCNGNAIEQTTDERTKDNTAEVKPSGKEGKGKTQNDSEEIRLADTSIDPNDERNHLEKNNASIDGAFWGTLRPDESNEERMAEAFGCTQQ